MNKLLPFALVIICLFSCNIEKQNSTNSIGINPNLEYLKYKPNSSNLVISRDTYYDQLYGFWLGECIANWTGLVTEMDKIGNIGEIKTGDFYTRDNLEQPDYPSIWGEAIPSNLSPTINFVLRDSSEIWGADDDTDIEYMYQQLLLKNNTSMLSPAFNGLSFVRMHRGI